MICLYLSLNTRSFPAESSNSSITNMTLHSSYYYYYLAITYYFYGQYLSSITSQLGFFSATGTRKLLTHSQCYSRTLQVARHTLWQTHFRYLYYP